MTKFMPIDDAVLIDSNGSIINRGQPDRGNEEDEEEGFFDMIRGKVNDFLDQDGDGEADWGQTIVKLAIGAGEKACIAAAVAEGVPPTVASATCKGTGAVLDQGVKFIRNRFTSDDDEDDDPRVINMDNYAPNQGNSPPFASGESASASILELRKLQEQKALIARVFRVPASEVGSVLEALKALCGIDQYTLGRL